MLKQHWSKSALVASGVLALVVAGKLITGNQSDPASSSTSSMLMATSDAGADAASTTLAIEDLGSIAFGTKLESKLAQYDPIGKQSHHFSIFRPHLDEFQFVHVNLDTGISTAITLPIRCYPNGKTYMHPTNQKAYFSCDSWGYVFEYDIITRQITFNQRVNQKGLLPIIFGDDGNVYMGGAGKYSTNCPHPNMDCAGNTDVHAYQFNPVTRQLNDLGAMNTRPWTTGYGYIYYIGSDGRYVFSGIGQDKWYLTVYDTQTGTRVSYGDEYFGPIDRGLVAKSRDGKWYYQVVRPPVNGKIPPHDMYLIADGVPSPTPAIKHPMFWIHSTSFSYGGWDVDESELAPMESGSVVTVSKLKYKKTGTTDWRTVVTEIPAAPIALRAITPSSGGKVAGIGSSSYVYFEYDPAAGASKVLSNTMFSVYSMITSDNDVFIAGYPQKQVWRYDTTQPFSNMHQLQIEGGKYAWFLDVDRRNDTLYIATHHERDATGGQLDWVNLNDETQTGFEREYFQSKNSPNGLAVAKTTNDLLYTAGNKILRFDTSQKKFISEMYPIPACPITKACIMGRVIASGGSMFVGVFTDSLNKPHFYGLDMATPDTVKYAKPLPGFTMLLGSNTRKQLELGPDGWVWVVAKDTIYKIEPETGTLVEVLKDSRLIGSESVIFIGRDLYTFNKEKIYRVAGVIPAAKTPCP